jgi:hypothetical protein
MTPGATLVLVIWIGCIVAGYYLGKYKGQPGAGLALTIILGLLGLLILAFIPRSHEAKVEAAAKRMRIEEEARQRAGYPYTLQSPLPGAPTDQPSPGPWEGPRQSGLT